MAVPVECALRDPLSKVSRPEQELINDKDNFHGDKDVLARGDAKHQEDEKQSYKQGENNNNKKEEIKDDKEASDRRNAGEQINNYRQEYQGRESRREFDLNDPHSLRKSLPMCTGDNDPRAKSKGSLLRFDSEDYDGQRKRNEANKLRLFLEEQIREKEELKAREKLADKHWNSTSAVNYNVRDEELKQKNRSESLRQIQASNLSAADARRNEKISERNRSSSAIYSCFGTSYSDTLNSPAGKSNINKTSSKDQLNEIEEYQKTRILEKEKAKEEEKAVDDYYLNLSGITSRQERDTAASIESKKRDESVRIREINKKLALEQRQRRKDLDKADHDCYPTDDFFAQFSKNTK